MTTTDTTGEHVAATCAVELASAVVDAGSELEIGVRVSCAPPCDLEGQAIEIRDQDGAVVATAGLAAYDEDAEANSTGALRVRVALEPGQYRWFAYLAAYEGEEITYDEAIAPVDFTVKAHTTSVLVWDVPSAVVAGETFRIKVGIKCSSQCRQAHRHFTIVDGEGMAVAASAVGTDLWPKSTALYFTELELQAPAAEGLLRWEAHCPEATLPGEGDGDLQFPHAPASAGFEFRCVSPPEFKVTVEAWDAAKQVPLAGTRVILHPYSTVTDDQGVAEIKVARGTYRLFVSRPKYTTFGTPVEIAGDLTTRVELALEPPPMRE